jgi:hypothetical protein
VELVDVQLEVRLLHAAMRRGGAGGSGRGGRCAVSGGEGGIKGVDAAAADVAEEVDVDDSDGGDEEEDEGAGIGEDAIEVDGAAIAAALSRRLAGRWVCAGELLIISGGGDTCKEESHDDAADQGFGFLRGVSLRCRVVSVNTMEPEAATTAIGYHCYRGLVTPDTVVYLHAEGDDRGVTWTPTMGTDLKTETDTEAELEATREYSSASGSGGGLEMGVTAAAAAAVEAATVTTAGGGLRVCRSRVRGDAAERSAAAAAELVTVHTNDGEQFPVRALKFRVQVLGSKF